MGSLKFTAAVLKRYPGLLALNAVLLFLTSLFDAAALFMLAPVVDTLLQREPSAVTARFAGLAALAGLSLSLKTALLVFVAFQFLRVAFFTLSWRAIVRAKYTVVRDLTVGCFGDFFNARWRFFTGSSQGTLVNTLTRELNNVALAFSVLGQMAANIGQLLLYLVVPFYISWKVTLASMAAGAVVAAPFIALGRVNYRLGKLITENANRLNGLIQENFGLAKIVLSYGNQQRSVETLSRSFDELAAPLIKCETLSVAIPQVYQPFGMLVVVVSLLGAQRMKVPISETAVLFYSLFKLIPIIGQLAERKNAVDAYLPSFEQVERLRDQARAAQEPRGGKPFSRLEKGLELEDVTFSHGGPTPILSHVSTRIGRGEIVALVGESGAGKSTLADLLIGLHAPETGRVLVDGVPLPELDLRSYRARLGYVTQDDLLFNLTIEENLRWAKPDATRAQLEEACKRAHAHEFVSRFPEGYATVVGDRGVRLSGGQQQRLALARALLRQPDLLILDEATSALDTESERLIQTAIDSLRGKTTVVVIAHRLSTIRNADRIYVLSQGRVEEQGSYDELVSRGGRFKRMTELQALEARK